MIKHQPATSLPWFTDSDTEIVPKSGAFIATTHQPEMTVGTQDEYDDAAYIVHAANAYPKLVEKVQLLKWALERLENERGSVIGTYVMDTNALLRELGEDS